MIGLRVLLAVGVSVAILGGLALFMTVRPTPLPTVDPSTADWVTGQTSIEVTLTFDAGPDPFALEATDAPSLLVLHHGRELLRRTDRVARGEVISITDLTQLPAGPNRFLVRAIPQESDSTMSHGLRLRVIHNDQTVADQTVWSDAGPIVEGEVVVQLASEVGAKGVDKTSARSDTGSEQAQGE